MKTKNLKLSKSEKWRKAYEEKVQQITGFSGFSINQKSVSIFSKLASFYSDVSPYSFMEAVFPPNAVWWIRTKRGKFKKLDYPFPNMLAGSKAEGYWLRYKKKFPSERKSRVEEILDSVKVGFSRLLQTRIELDDLEGIYYLTVDGTLSPWLFLGISGAFDWYVLQVGTGKLERDFFEELQEKYNFLRENVDLNLKVKKLVESYVGN